MHAGDPQISKLVSLAQQLEGVARNASTHAAGVVISREPLTELMPLQRATNSDALMTQYEMHGIEALGLLKFDFLGLSNLTILRKAVDLIAEHRGVTVDLERIPLDDEKTFELLASGETTGVFQLESAGMRRYIRELRPTSVYDLAAMVALYRPGPMDNIPAYIRRKHGQEQVEYLHPLLEPYLDKTYGIFVYQEDIMAAAIALGGFTGPEADTLGYAIRKKKSSVLRAQKEKFVSQAAERGVAPKVIDAVFKAFEPFERYGFNKAHATCYGLIAYQTAYLKANYTVEYMTSVLTAFRDNAEKVAAAVAECRRLGIDVRTPDIHRSHLGFTVEDDAIRFGLLAVKNVGEGAIESIIKAREEGGEFRSLTDFCTRVDLRLANRKVLESLTRVGALNVLGHPAQILLGLDDALAAGQAAQRDRITGQTSLFDMGGEEASQLERPLPATPETPVRERLRWEKELMGLYLSDHPMGEVADRVGLFVTAYSGDLKDETLDGQRVVHRRDRDRQPDDHHEVEVDDGGGDARGPAGDARGRRVPQDVRADDRHVARRGDPARRGPRGPSWRRGVAARGLRVGLGRGRGPRAGGVRARGRVAGQARATGTGRGGCRPGARQGVGGNGNGGGSGWNGNGAGGANGARRSGGAVRSRARRSGRGCRRRRRSPRRPCPARRSRRCVRPRARGWPSGRGSRGCRSCRASRSRPASRSPATRSRRTS